MYGEGRRKRGKGARPSSFSTRAEEHAPYSVYGPGGAANGGRVVGRSKAFCAKRDAGDEDNSIDFHRVGMDEILLLYASIHL